MKNSKFKIISMATAFCVLHFAFLIFVNAQEMPPEPSAPKSVKIPAVKEITLDNGLKIAIVERSGVPLINVQLLTQAGAAGFMEEMKKAGLADITVSLLTKGTKTRTATQIAEEIEFLGADLNSTTGWISSKISLNVMSDKLDKALMIMSDVAINPSFNQTEIDLLKSQMLDGLKYNLTQPGFLATYVASSFSFEKHPIGGTIASIDRITRDDIFQYYKQRLIPEESVLIFVGDISSDKAVELTKKYFGNWSNPKTFTIKGGGVDPLSIRESAESVLEKKKLEMNQPLVKRILVIDLPNSGQAAVSFAKSIKDNGRIYRKPDQIRAFEGKNYYPAMVLNSLLGGGYSSRLNQEIRIKRGLSYGAGSSFNWEWSRTDFTTRTQTKNETAAEVAQLVETEIKKLSEREISDTELNPRRLVLTGNFGRNLETNQGLANALADLYSFGLQPDLLNSFMNNVMSVKDKQIQTFAAENFQGGDIIIVGDYTKFKDDLAKRFPNMKIDIVKASELDLSKENLMTEK